MSKGAGNSGYPRITYHSAGKTFDRLLKENTLEDVKRSVRTKLGLAEDVSVRLVQLREGLTVELDDDDDFEAFCVAAASSHPLNVQVTVVESDTQAAKEPTVTDGAMASHAPQETALRKRKASTAHAPHLEAQPDAKKSKGGLQDNAQDETEAGQTKRQGGGRKKSRGKEKQVPPGGEEAEAPLKESKGKEKQLPLSDEEVEAPLKNAKGSDEDVVVSKRKKEKRKGADDGKQVDDVQVPQGSPLPDNAPLSGGVNLTRDSPAPFWVQIGTVSKRKNDGPSGRFPEQVVPSTSVEEDPVPKPKKSRKRALDTPQADDTTIPPIDAPTSTKPTKGDASESRSGRKRSKGKAAQGSSRQSDLDVVDPEQTGDDDIFAQSLATAISGTSAIGEPVTLVTEDTVKDPEVQHRRKGDAKKKSSRKGKQKDQSDAADIAAREEIENMFTELTRKVVQARSGSAADSVRAESVDGSPEQRHQAQPKIPRGSRTISDGQHAHLPNPVEPPKAPGPLIAPSKPSARRTKAKPEVPCPVCLATPLHYRYLCPVIIAGAESIQKRIDELKRNKAAGDAQLIQELEALLLKALAKERSKEKAISADVPSIPARIGRHASNALGKLAGYMTPSRANKTPSSAAIISTSTTPSLGFLFPTVTPASELREEEEESSDDDNGDEGLIKGKDDAQPVISIDVPALDRELAAVISGPANTHSLLDEIASDSEEEEEEEEPILEEDEPEVAPQRVSRIFVRDSSSEQEDEETSGDAGDEVDRARSTSSTCSVAATLEGVSQQKRNEVAGANTGRPSPLASKASQGPHTDHSLNRLGRGSTSNPKAVVDGREKNTGGTPILPGTPPPAATTSYRSPPIKSPLSIWADERAKELAVKPIPSPLAPAGATSVSRRGTITAPPRPEGPNQGMQGKSRLERALSLETPPDSASDNGEPSKKRAATTGQDTPGPNRGINPAAPVQANKPVSKRARNGIAANKNNTPAGRMTRSTAAASQLPPPPVPIVEIKRRGGPFKMLEQKGGSSSPVPKEAEGKTVGGRGLIAERSAPLNGSVPTSEGRLQAPHGWAAITAVSQGTQDSSSAEIDQLDPYTVRRPESENISNVKQLPNAANKGVTSQTALKPGQITSPRVQRGAGRNGLTSGQNTAADSDSEAELAPKRFPLSRKEIHRAGYPTLSDIASQLTLFKNVELPAASTPANHSGEQYDPYGTGEDDEDEDDESVPDSGADENSHIPASRRAGGSIQSRNSRGLLSYA